MTTKNIIPLLMLQFFVSVFSSSFVKYIRYENKK